MTNHSNLKLVESCVAASLAIAMAPAASGQVATVVADSARVPYGDLDLASATGEKVLNARVWTAAKKLCRPIALATDIGTRACVKNAFSDARPQIVSAIEQARNLSLADMTRVVHVRAR